MLLVRLLDGKYKNVTLEDGVTMTYIPDEVSNIQIYQFGETIHDGARLEYKDLTKMLRCLARKLPSIGIYGHATRSPNYLSLLISATQTAERLSIRDVIMDDFDSDIGYSCLMSGLLIQEGLKTLQLHLGNEISPYQAQLLFRGIADSSCLETLELEYLTFEDRELATHAFAEALRQNRSLKVLNLESCSLVHFQEIFRAAILDTKIRSITIVDTESDGPLDFGVALDVLSSEGCQLQSLALYHMDMRFGDLDDPSKTNTSVNEVNLTSLGLDSSHLAGICSIFKSMTRLRLNNNDIGNISPLDAVLIGDDMKLQKLCLGSCGINENCIIEFFHKLPQMKRIQRIELNANPFLRSNEWMEVLPNVIRKNTSLECILFAMRGEEPEERGSFYSRLELALSLNRAWRRHMENDTTTTTTENNNSRRAALPSALWPLVLERAAKISYFSCTDPSKKAPTAIGTDVIFWLLRQRMVAEVDFAL